jgi:hypothetical protein
MLKLMEKKFIDPEKSEVFHCMTQIALFCPILPLYPFPFEILAEAQ